MLHVIKNKIVRKLESTDVKNQNNWSEEHLWEHS